jgi:formate dehydrogenase iron-sulfur subunit
MLHRAILVDVVKCIGCGECVAACQRTSGQPAHEAHAFDASTFTFLHKPQTRPDLRVRRLCMHCEEPACASACPVGALHKTEEGPVTYDPGKCMGCRYCLLACPFGVPTYEWRATAPRVRKCQMCVDRGAKGPACTEACPAEATVTGDRAAIVALAQRRLREEPKLYHPHVYGLKEVGGTSVLTIGPCRPADLGLPTGLRMGPLPELTWSALRHVPDVALFGSVILGGLYWLTRRKEEVHLAERGGGEREAVHLAEGEDDSSRPDGDSGTADSDESSR